MFIKKDDAVDYKGLVNTLTKSAQKGIHIQVNLDEANSLLKKLEKLENVWDEVAPGVNINSPKQVQRFLEGQVRSNKRLSWHFYNNKHNINLDWCYYKGMKEAALIKNMRFLKQKIQDYLNWGDKFDPTSDASKGAAIHPTVSVGVTGRVNYANPALGNKSSEVLRKMVFARTNEIVCSVDIVNQEALLFVYLFGTAECKEMLCPQDYETPNDFYGNLLKQVYGKGDPKDEFAGLGLVAMQADNSTLDINKAWREEREEVKSNWISLMYGAMPQNLKSLYNDAKPLWEFFKRHIHIDTITNEVYEELQLSGGRVYTYFGREVDPWAKDAEKDAKSSGVTLKSRVGRSIKEKNFLKKLMTEDELDKFKKLKTKDTKEQFFTDMAQRVNSGEFGDGNAYRLSTLAQLQRGDYAVKLRRKDVFKIINYKVQGTAVDILSILVSSIEKRREISTYFTLHDEIFVSASAVWEKELERKAGNRQAELASTGQLEKKLAEIVNHTVEGVGLFQVKVSKVNYESPGH